MTERQMVNRIRSEVFSGMGFAVIPQVRASTGYQRDEATGAGIPTRTIDALVCQLWPSRGIWVGGIEVKVSRGDWLRELKQPDKSEALARYCQRFYVAVPRLDVVKMSELGTWGLIAPLGNGKLGVLREAKPKHEAEIAPFDAGFVAAIIRRLDARYRDPHSY